MVVTGRLQIDVFVNLARDHLRSACRLTRFAYALENGTPSREAGQERVEHDTFVIGALIFAGAFVDGEINACYAMAAEGSDPNALPEPMRGQLRDDMANFFGTKEHRYVGTLRKYQRLMELAGRTPLAEKDAPYARVRLLLDIRNALVHYGQGPVTTSTGGPDPAPPGRFEDEVSALGIPKSRWASVGDPFFPRSMLSHELAATAIAWAVAWVDAFYAQLGVTPSPLEGVRSEIRTLP